MEGGYLSASSSHVYSIYGHACGRRGIYAMLHSRVHLGKTGQNRQNDQWSRDVKRRHKWTLVGHGGRAPTCLASILLLHTPQQALRCLLSCDGDARRDAWFCCSVVPYSSHLAHATRSCAPRARDGAAGKTRAGAGRRRRFMAFCLRVNTRSAFSWRGVRILCRIFAKCTIRRHAGNGASQEQAFLPVNAW